tara:strand:+ start:8 stop:316 length:309 start_codon:yes stop_codon:yes gene_type:complete
MHISDDTKAFDVELIHRFLSQHSLWVTGISLPLIKKSLTIRFLWGYIGTHQIAFAQVILDYGTFANLVDVYVMPKYQGRGYGKQLPKAVFAPHNFKICASSP